MPRTYDTVPACQSSYGNTHRERERVICALREKCTELICYLAGIFVTLMLQLNAFSFSKKRVY